MTLTIDVGANRHPISQDIYRMSQAGQLTLNELNIPVNHWGGTLATRYNVHNGNANSGSDFFFENNKQMDDPADFAYDNRAFRKDSLMTMPTVGWIANDNQYACGFSIAKYGAQTRHDDVSGIPNMDDCGNGIQSPSGAFVTGNDPADTSIAESSTYITDFMQNLNARVGTAADGGVRFYGLDDEPDRWSIVDRDVDPNPLTYDELIGKSLPAADAIKAAGNPATQALPVRSTRSLRDSTYTDESWIGQPVRLIPRRRTRARRPRSANTTSAAPTRSMAPWPRPTSSASSAASAWTWRPIGPTSSTTGTSTRSRWPSRSRCTATTTARGTPSANVGVRAVSSDRGRLSTYAAQRSTDHIVTVIVINKTGGAITAPPNVRGIYPATTYGVYTYSPANLSRIVASTGSGLTRTYPANSITLLTLKPGRAPAVASAVHAKGKALGHRKVLIKIAVSAHVVPAGEVVVFKGRKKLKTATLVRGKVAIKLKKQKVGKVRYTIKYTGSAAVLPSSARLKVRMR